MREQVVQEEVPRADGGPGLQEALLRASHQLLPEGRTLLETLFGCIILIDLYIADPFA